MLLLVACAGLLACKAPLDDSTEGRRGAHSGADTGSIGGLEAWGPASWHDDPGKENVEHCDCENSNGRRGECG